MELHSSVCSLNGDFVLEIGSLLEIVLENLGIYLVYFLLNINFGEKRPSDILKIYIFSIWLE